MRSLAGVETEEVVRWEIVIKATDGCRDRGAGETSDTWERTRSLTGVETEDVVHLGDSD